MRNSFHSGVLSLLSHVIRKDISYCHFKSNEHVAEGMCGDTDLDILAARDRHADIVDALNRAGFKLFASGTMTRYPAVEDWLGIDPETGNLAHLHIHWQMIAGEPYLKGYRLPWERQILANRVWNAEYGIHTASPEMELILLLTRAALKLRTRSVVAARFGGSAHGGDLKREYAWLLARLDMGRFETLAGSILPADIVPMMRVVVGEGGLDSREFLGLRQALLQHLAPWRSYAPGHARLLRWQRELSRRLLHRLLRRIGMLPVDRRSPASGGMIVALIGADGSGKSTQANSLVKWLGWKIDVARVYFGSGDGPMSWPRAALLWLQSRLGRSRQRKAISDVNGVPSNKSSSSAPSPGMLQRTFKGLYAISLAFEKRSAIRKATKARNRGMIVICDRYPQNQIAGYNDGPLLTEWIGTGKPWSTLARLEQRLLSVFSSVSPDLVIKLNVSEDVSAARKADTPKEMIARKIAAVRDLSFGPECQTIELDANQPLDEITLAVRINVWKLL